jgi:hypothetical protein
MFLHTNESDADTVKPEAIPRKALLRDKRRPQEQPERLLQQLSSQIVSAVRLVLNAKSPPDLFWLGGSVCVDLMCSGLVADPVVVKRLVKQLLPPDILAAEEDKWQDTAKTYQPLQPHQRIYSPPQDPKRARHLVLCEHVARVGLLARLKVLAHDVSDYGIFGGISDLEEVSVHTCV